MTASMLDRRSTSSPPTLPHHRSLFNNTKRQLINRGRLRQTQAATALPRLQECLIHPLEQRHPRHKTTSSQHQITSWTNDNTASTPNIPTQTPAPARPAAPPMPGQQLLPEHRRVRLPLPPHSTFLATRSPLSPPHHHPLPNPTAAVSTPQPSTAAVYGGVYVFDGGGGGDASLRVSRRRGRWLEEWEWWGRARWWRRFLCSTVFGV